MEAPSARWMAAVRCAQGAESAVPKESPLTIEAGRRGYTTVSQETSVASSSTVGSDASESESFGSPEREGKRPQNGGGPVAESSDLEAPLGSMKETPSVPSMVEVAPKAASPSSPGPEVWRTSASSLTPSQAMSDASESLLAAMEQDTAERLSVTVDLGEMGLVKVTADRGDGGIRLALRADTQSTVFVLESQASALLSLLQQAGWTVLGLQVQVGGDRGTAAARRRQTASGARLSGDVRAGGASEEAAGRVQRTRVDVLA
jgi:hypothetical protein